jgi:type II secretory pathway pseudopilin PulG
VTGWRRIYDERRRVILPLVIVLAVNVAVLLLAVLPLSRSVVAARADNVQATVDLANAQRLQSQARDAAGSRTRADQELTRFYSEVLPRDLLTGRRSTIRWIQDAARDAGLEFSASRFDFDEVRDSRLSRAYSTVTLAGRYGDVRKFLYAVETAQEFLVVEKVGLAQSEATGSAAMPLVVTLTVATYYLTPDHEAAGLESR